MSEERASKGHPTKRGAVGKAATRSTPRRGAPGEPAREVVVAVRFSESELAAADRIREQLGGSRSDAVRAAVVAAGEAIESGSVDRIDASLSKRVAARRPVVVQADERLLEDLRSAMASMASAHSQLAFQIQKIGNNWNQVARLAHSDEPVDTDAVEHVARALEAVHTVVADSASREASLIRELVARLKLAG